MRRQRDLLLLVTWAAAAATSALGQTVAPLAELTSSGTATTASVPDFSGKWTHPYFGLGPPLSGPGPVARRPGRLLVGDHTNPILKPEAAEAVKKHGEIELGGDAAPNPRNQCWPEGVPFVFRNTGMQMLHHTSTKAATAANLPRERFRSGGSLAVISHREMSAVRSARHGTAE